MRQSVWVASSTSSRCAAINRTPDYYYISLPSVRTNFANFRPQAGPNSDRFGQILEKCLPQKSDRISQSSIGLPQRRTNMACWCSGGRRGEPVEVAEVRSSLEIFFSPVYQACENFERPKIPDRFVKILRGLPNFGQLRSNRCWTNFAKSGSSGVLDQLGAHRVVREPAIKANE